MLSRHQGIGMTSQRTRDRMVEKLQAEGIKLPAVLEVMRNTPRHIFVDEALASRSYENTPLPIGHGQTISQPYIVARMTEILLDAGPLHKVLEVGTGSGYQAAVLAQLVPKVYSVERIKPLYLRSMGIFSELQLTNVVQRHSDGSWGWKEFAPFDGIILTAAPEHGVPEELLQQLADGGRLVAPVGGQDYQELVLYVRHGEHFDRQVMGRVMFVPMLGGVE